MKVWQRNLLLGVVAVVLAAAPLIFQEGAQWKGADDRGMAAIQEIQPDYQPWFTSVFSPADNERLFFGGQALIGAALLSAFMGYLVGRRHAQTGTEGNERRVALLVTGIGLVVAVALVFVSTEFRELQDFISAVQGIAIGTIGFHLAYPLGRRSKPAAASGVTAGVQAAPARTAARV